jgi:hypothetical protein
MRKNGERKSCPLSCSHAGMSYVLIDTNQVEVLPKQTDFSSPCFFVFGETYHLCHLVQNQADIHDKTPYCCPLKSRVRLQLLLHFAQTMYGLHFHWFLTTGIESRLKMMRVLLCNSSRMACTFLFCQNISGKGSAALDIASALAREREPSIVTLQKSCFFRHS